jgi:conjugal transfer pilus assembly protein TraV
MTIRSITSISVFAAILSLSGCASMFGGSDETVCNGNQGVPCTSIRTAYQMSNHTTQFAKGTGQGGAMVDAPVAAVSVSLPQPVAQPMPVLEPAQVMRVWVNRWVDASGNLNYPSLVFTEVTPRRWAGTTSNKQAPGKIVTAYRIEPNADQDAAMVTSAGKPIVSKPAATQAPGPLQMPSSAPSSPVRAPDPASNTLPAPAFAQK